MTKSLSTRDQLHVTLNQIEEKLSSLKALETQTYKTNGEFRFNPTYTNNSPIYIHTTKDLAILLSVYGYVKQQEERYNEAAKICELSNYPVFTWCGYSGESWLYDIKMRIGLVSHDSQIKKLKDAKAKLSQFMTEEDRLLIVLKEIQDL